MMDSSARTEEPLAEFASLTDPAAVMPILRRAVEPQLFPGWKISQCWVRTIRHRTYRPGPKRKKSSVLVIYDLVLQASSGHDRRQAQLFLRSHLDERGARSTVCGDRRLVPVPEVHGYAWVFPTDPAMAALALLTDAGSVTDHLPYEALSSSLRSPGDVARVQVDPLRYKPEDRCAIRLRIVSTNGTTEAIIAKTFSSSTRAEALYRLAELVWDHSHRSGGGRFAVPRPLGFDTASHTMWLSELAGRRPRGQDLDRDGVERIAAALASLHGGRLLVPKPRIALDQLAETERKARAMSELFPDLREPLEALVAKLGLAVDGLDPHRLCNVHGAFRLRQLLVDDARIGIVDFDSLCSGDPVEDLADLLVDLGLGTGQDSAADLRSTFVSAYEEVSGRTVDRERLRWHVPTQLLKRAYWLRLAATGRAGAAAELGTRVRLALASLDLSLAEVGV